MFRTTRQQLLSGITGDRGFVSRFCAALVLVCMTVGVTGNCLQADTLVVSNRGDETVQLFDTETKKVLKTVSVGVGAHEFAVSPDGRTVVGSCYGSGAQHQVPDNRLLVLDLDQPDKSRLIELGDNPRPNDLRFLADGKKLAVTSEVRQRILIVDVEHGRVDRQIPFDEKAGHMMATSADGKRAYVPCVISGKVIVVSLDAQAPEVVLAQIDTAVGAEGVDLSPDGKWLWVACNRSESIAIVDTETNTVAETIETDGFPFRVRFTPDGQSVVVSHPAAHEVRIYDTATRRLRGKVALDRGLPTGLAVSADGTRAYVVCSGVEKIAEVDLKRLTIVHWYEAGKEPDAVAVTSAS